MKKCTKCKQNREIVEFRKDKSRKDGLYPQCKICCKAYKEAYDTNHKGQHSMYRFERKEEKAEYDSSYRTQNKERYRNYEEGRREEKSLYNAIYAKINPGKMNARSAKRNAAKFQATPKWLTRTQLFEIEGFYIEAARLTKETGIPHHVDHIVPLQGKTVRGLHVPWNLQILTAIENLSKGNRID
jgi:hypothetical protein